MTEMPPSFLFVVNELPTNDNLERSGSVPPRMIDQRYLPPVVSQGFLAQEPGDVFRWKEGVITEAPGYMWVPQQNGNPLDAQGTIYADSTTGPVWPVYYRAATVFYCNHFTQFFTARGDASTRDIFASNTAQEDTWNPLMFIHENNISYVQHIGDQDYLAVRKASWIEQLLPRTYRRHSHDGPTVGGLAGLLPIVIALVAFSCDGKDSLRQVLINDRAWRGHKWIPHRRENGRRERRGMVVTVYLDPENTQGSTLETISNLESGPIPIFQ